MKRAKHSLSHYKLLTSDMGELVPVGCYEVLPGDTVQQHTSFLLRVSPLVAPVMHPVQVRVHSFFVPNRLLWPEGWEDFITGGPDGTGTTEPYPVINSGSGFAAGTLADYFGIPPAVANLEVCAMPFRAYNMCFNEYYRDQDLVSEVAEDNLTVQKIAWEKDYFTAARPWTQKGPEVTMPLGVSAPVKGLVRGGGPNDGSVLTGYVDQDNVPVAAGTGYFRGADGVPSQAVGFRAAGDNLKMNVFADLANASAANINELRKAFALQRYAEARARYGSRYTEYLRYLGVRSSDARLQRPEYLGGGKQTISFSEVLKTGSQDDPAEAIGTMKGHGIAALRSRRFRRFFEEHGYVITLMSVRPRTMYNDGLHRSWSRRTKEDYWQRELEHIGQQEIYQREVYAPSVTGSAIFGYGDRYSEYRHLPSQVCGDFRSTLNYWHLARIFAADPALNGSFVQCDPSKRIYAEQTQDALWIMANNSIVARRMVSGSAASFIF